MASFIFDEYSPDYYEPEPPPSPDEMAQADAEIEQDDREFAENGPYE